MAMSKLAAASLLGTSPFIAVCRHLTSRRRWRTCGWQHLSQVHTIGLTALRRTTLLDLHRVVHSNTARYAKRLGTMPMAHMEGPQELEVPAHLQDMEIPLEDMGDVIVLTGL